MDTSARHCPCVDCLRQTAEPGLLDLRRICGREAEVLGHPDQGPPHERADLLGAQVERCRPPDRPVAELGLAGPSEDREIDQVQGAEDARAAARLGMAVLDVELQPRCACGRYIHDALAGCQHKDSGRLPGADKEADQFAGRDAKLGRYVALWVPKTYATRRYSWMTPPARSCRRIRK